ncbi:MAG: hypothetical protein WHU54_07020 [Candidatus Bathyarchaeia archaeon]
MSEKADIAIKAMIRIQKMDVAKLSARIGTFIAEPSLMNEWGFIELA